MGEAKQVAVSCELHTHVAHTARAGHTPPVPQGRAGRAQAHPQLAQKHRRSLQLVYVKDFSLNDN